MLWCKLKMSNHTTKFYALSQSFSFSDIIVITTYFLLNLAVGIWVRVTGVCFRHVPFDAMCMYVCVLCVCVSVLMCKPSLCQSSCRVSRNTLSGYFLAGRDMAWWPVSEMSGEMCSSVVLGNISLMN